VGLTKYIKYISVWELVLYYGPYETQGIILFLTNAKILHFCGLYVGLRIGSVFGPFSSRRSFGRVQSFGNESTVFMKPVQPAACLAESVLILGCPMAIFYIFKWVMHILESLLPFVVLRYTS
jgi:hypothetical protein